MSTLSPQQKRLLDYLQADFPLCTNPYDVIGHAIGCSSIQAHTMVLGLREVGIIRRIGGSFSAAKLGYHSLLVAAQVATERLDAVAVVVNAFPEVTHNYEREGEYNLWFTIIAASTARLEEILAAIRAQPGVLRLFPLPAERIFKIRVQFPFSATPASFRHTGNGDTHSAQTAAEQPDALDRRIIARLCGDLDNAYDPFSTIATELDTTSDELFTRLHAYRQTGMLRRFGAIIRHRESGFTANGLSVWNIPAAQVVSAANLMTQYAEITHCYQRPRVDGWPYNLYAMIHGRSREACAHVLGQIADQLGSTDHRILFSLREFKKTSMTYFASNMSVPVSAGQ